MYLAIVGTHPDTRGNAPFDDPEAEIWAFNEAAQLLVEGPDGAAVPWLKRVNAIFQMHTPAVYRNQLNRSHTEHWKWLQEDHDFVVYMQDTDPDVPASVKYPIEDIVRHELDNLKVGKHQRPVKFFTSSIAYALALAAYKSYRYERVEVYGVEMRAETEYVYQRDCVAFWAGILTGKGVPVHFYCGEGIFAYPLYGYESDIEYHLEDFDTRRVKYLAEIETARARALEAQAAFDNACLIKDRVFETLSELLDAKIRLGAAEGVLVENDRYAYKVGQMIEAHQHSMIDRHEFEVALVQAQAAAEDAKGNLYRTAGAMDYIWTHWLQNRNPVAIDQIRHFAVQHIQAGYEHGKHKGVQTYNEDMTIEFDKRWRAAGGEKAAAALTNQP